MNSNVRIEIAAGILLSLILIATARAEGNNGGYPPNKYGIVLSGHWNSLKNSKLNNYFIPQLNPEGDKINFGYGFSSEFRYYLSRKISLSAGLIHIGGSSELKRIVVDPNDPQGTNTTSTANYIKTRLFAPTLSIRYHRNIDKIELSLGIGESFLFGRPSTDFSFFPSQYGSQTPENKYSSTGMGFQFFGAAAYRLSGRVSYIMETGFRKFETGDLIDNGKDHPMQYGFVNYPGVVNLDYSGPYISTGLMLRLF